MATNLKDAELRQQEAANLTQNSNDNGNDKPKSKGRVNNPLWSVMKNTRDTFGVQPVKTNEMKLTFMNAFIHKKFSDEGKFWASFMEMVNELINDSKFNYDCRLLGCTPENVAEHIIVLGSKTKNDVLREGVQKVIGNDIYLYKDRFTKPEDVDQYLPPFYTGERRKTSAKPVE